MSDINPCKCNDGWEATLNTQPPNRNILTVTGSVTCPDQGLKLTLEPAVPPGIIPEELLLDIKVEKHGNISHMVTIYDLKYTQENARYKSVRIVPCNLTIDVNIIT
jgi:hypothetical protein